MNVFIGVLMFIIVVTFSVLAILLLNYKYFKYALISFIVACVYCTLVLGRTNKIMLIQPFATITMITLQKQDGKEIYLKENRSTYTYRNMIDLLTVKTEGNFNIKKSKSELYFVEKSDRNLNTIYLSTCTYKKIKTDGFWGYVAEKVHLTNSEFTKEKYVIYISHDSYMSKK